MPQVLCFRIETTANLSLIEPDQLPRSWSDLERDYLVLVKPSGAADLADWARATDFASAVPDDMIDPDEDSALFQRRPGSVYIQFPTNLDGATRSKAYLSLLCLPHRLIVAPSGTVLNLDKMLADACTPGHMRGADLGSLLAYLISSYAKSLVVLLRQLRNDIADIEDQLAAHAPSNGGPREREQVRGQVQALWPQVTAMLDLVDDQAFVVRTLRELDSPVLELSPHRDYLDDLAADSDYAQRVAVRLEARCRLLGERLESIQADITDRRLRLLTIVSAVFLPLTLVTGYFGMNFVDMPLLQIPGATVVLVLLMIGLTTGLLLYFRRAHWL